MYVDIDGNELEEGDSVIVPEPGRTDLWNHSFSGTVIAFRKDGIVTVEDQDGEEFDVEAHLLELEWESRL